MKRPRRKFVVTLHFRSGERHSLTCRDFRIRKCDDGNQLGSITVGHGKLPFYTRLDAIDMIVVRRSLFFWGIW